MTGLFEDLILSKPKQHFAACTQQASIVHNTACNMSAELLCIKSLYIISRFSLYHSTTNMVNPDLLCITIIRPCMVLCTTSKPCSTEIDLIVHLNFSRPWRFRTWSYITTSYTMSGITGFHPDPCLSLFSLWLWFGGPVNRKFNKNLTFLKLNFCQFSVFLDAYTAFTLTSLTKAALGSAGSTASYQVKFLFTLPGPVSRCVCMSERELQHGLTRWDRGAMLGLKFIQQSASSQAVEEEIKSLP